MNHVFALTRRQLREARLSLAVAALATSATIGAVHAWFPGPAAVSEASALAISVLSALWTLYFASDSFAGDSASGRLATLSTLPISTRALWASRLGFVALASLAQIVWAIAVGYGAQFAFGDVRSLEHFDDALRSYAPWAFALPVLASAAMLASLVVESALAAMVGSLLLLGGFAALLAPLTRVLAVAGVDLRPSVEQAELGAALLALLLLALGAHSFARGQRRLGARRVRVFHAAWPIGAVLLAAGVATAAEHRRRLAVELDDPQARIRRASASSDGRFLALEVAHDFRGAGAPPPNLWLLDLDSDAREVLARPGELLDDRYLHFSLPWDLRTPLRALELSSLSQRELVGLLEVTAGEATWEVSRQPADADVLTSWLSTRAVPEWASVARRREPSGAGATIVRWRERDFATSFENAVPLRGALPTSVAGRVLVLREQGLMHHHMESGAETFVFPRPSSGAMWPSPTGAGVLVSTPEAHVVLDAATGAPLHEPWLRERWAVSWIDGGDAARVVQLHPVGVANASSRIVDLDSGVGFDVERAIDQAPAHRVGSRGYVFVRADGDLVWVDLQGRLVKVLVER